MTSDVQISVVSEVTDDVVAAFQQLIPQLSSSNPPPSKQQLERIVESDSCHLLLASEGDRIHGSLTLVIFPIPTGVRAWIEDVVVDGDARGKGVGATLNKAAIELATDAGATTIDLTSRPSREAANRLYQRLGFKPRDTNVYRYEL